jgi:transposase
MKSLKLFAENGGENLIFMDDNARVVTQYLADHGIERMDWPSKSPDLNPIEHVWNMMGKSIEELEVQPNGLQLLTGCGAGGCMGCHRR